MSSVSYPPTIRTPLHLLDTDVHVQPNVQPTLDQVHDVLSSTAALPNPPNLVPICSSISAEFLTPSSIYLKVSSQ